MSFKKMGDIVPLNMGHNASTESEFVKFGECTICKNKCMINASGICEECKIKQDIK